MISLILFPVAASADTYTLDLSSTSSFDKASSTGFWNITDQRIQAPWVVTPVATLYAIDFGDGSDGDFIDGPAQAGISINGTTITINTTVKSLFQFKTFTLSAPYTINLTGNNPLTLRVLGTATIAGAIHADGAPGLGNNGLLGGLGDWTTSSAGPNPGGVGANGGGAGGTGARDNGTQNPTAGSSEGVNSVGGGIGTNNGFAAPIGGGGGCVGVGPDGGGNATPALGGANAGVCAATTRTVLGGNFDALFFGGSGGGGGGAGGNTGGIFVAGGGGGGGGGALHLAAYKVAVTGTITLQGGEGGNYRWENNIPNAGGSCGGATIGGCAGGGGGGSGGNLWIQTSAITNGTGSINVSGGTKGISPASGSISVCCNTSVDGGAGARGIFRYDTGASTFASVAPAGAVPGAAPVLNPASVATTGSYIVVSKAIDLSQGIFSIGSAAETLDTVSSGCGSGGTTQIFYEGSQDGISFEHPVLKANISELNDYPYIRFKVSYTLSGGTPACLTALQINYIQRDISNLVLKGGLFCGTTRRPDGKSPGSPLDIIGDFLLLGLAAFFGIKLARNPSQTA